MAQRTRVGLHRFETYARHTGRDGANLAYSELVRLLDESPDIHVVPHDVVRLFEDDAMARSALANCDVVVSTVGPHAYLYFYLRERLGLAYRIVRDVRTALWNGYLLQEALVAPYIRPDDSVTYSSAYSRDLFRYLFPHVPRGSQHICYPLVRWFPASTAKVGYRVRDRSVRIIGYVGRLTDDKNFPQALDLVAELRRRRPGRFMLQAIGEGRPPTGHPRAVRERLGDRLDGYQWIPPVDRDRLWAHYASFDLLLFPSTSTLETLGRVLVEATYAGVPVLAASHGASQELLVEDALLPTTYRTGKAFTTHLAAALGDVDVRAAAERLIDGPPVPHSSAHALFTDDPAAFLMLVRCGNDAARAASPRTGTLDQQRFIESLRMVGLDVPLSQTVADRAIQDLRTKFVNLHRRSSIAYPATLAELLVRSRYRAKTLQFIRRSALRGEDFTNIGGVDLQFSHLLRFYPTFKLVDVTRDIESRVAVTEGTVGADT
jgi:glycosyltransferase involved in cell wall biosynthesis